MRITLDAEYGIYPEPQRKGKGARPLKLCTTGAWLPGLKAIEAGLCCHARYADRRATPRSGIAIHAAMPAMLQGR
jgi:hypothetical protein